MSAYNDIHVQFKCNGTSYSREALKEVAYSLIKEGETYEQEIGDFLLDWLDASTTVSVMTSGSTGKPKRIHLKKQQMVHSAKATGHFFGLEAGFSVLHCLPSQFIAGKMMWVRAMVLGLEIDYVAPSTTPDIVKQYDFAAMIPLQLENSLPKIDLINTLIIGGAPMSKVLKGKIQNHKTRIFETYGMTETITHIAAKQVNPSVAGAENVFKTLPEVGISRDSRSCLVIDAPALADTKIITNDIVALLSETEFIWKGRNDNVINSGGVKLVPEEIESVVSHLIPSPFFVAGLPDETLGERLVLFIEGNLDVVVLKEKLDKIPTLDKFQKPKEIISLPNFIRTPNGKIQRAKTLEIIK